MDEPLDTTTELYPLTPPARADLPVERLTEALGLAMRIAGRSGRRREAGEAILGGAIDLIGAGAGLLAVTGPATGSSRPATGSSRPAPRRLRGAARSTPRTGWSVLASRPTAAIDAHQSSTLLQLDRWLRSASRSGSDPTDFLFCSGEWLLSVVRKVDGRNAVTSVGRHSAALAAEAVDLQCAVRTATSIDLSAGSSSSAAPGEPSASGDAVWSAIALQVRSLDHETVALVRAFHRAALDAGILSDGQPDLLATLSRGERETVQLLLTGKSETAIATLLRRSRHTVHSHVKRLYRKLNVASRAELMAKLLPQG